MEKVPDWHKRPSIQSCVWGKIPIHIIRSEDADSRSLPATKRLREQRCFTLPRDYFPPKRKLLMILHDTVINLSLFKKPLQICAGKLESSLVLRSNNKKGLLPFNQAHHKVSEWWSTATSSKSACRTYGWVFRRKYSCWVSHHWSVMNHQGSQVLVLSFIKPCTIGTKLPNREHCSFH